MTVLWDQHEATVSDIVTALGSVNYSTVQTLLRILETKGYDPLADVKEAGARRWVAAVNAEGSYGQWAYRIVRSPRNHCRLHSTS